MIDLLRHSFVQNAFLAGTIVAIISGFMGYFVVLRGQTFACEALSHIGFAGATGAALVGASSLEGNVPFHFDCGGWHGCARQTTEQPGY